MNDNPLIFVVAAALIDDMGRVLLARRPEGKRMAGLWEFPGGKVHDNETPEQALIREIEEELGIVLKEENLEPGGFVSHSYNDFHLFMPLYICRKWERELKALEHEAIEWADLAALETYDMPEADIPLIDQLRRNLV